MIKKELFVFTTARKLREFLTKKDNSIIPKTMLISDFFSRANYSLNYNEASNLDRLFCMQRAVKNTKNLSSKLKISSNFFEFLKNNEYIFSFFKELAVTKTKIYDLKNSDVYAVYDEHLEILEELLKNYKNELKNSGYYDEITIVDSYEINKEFIEYYDEITIYIDGILTNFELEILDACKQYSDIKLVINANYLTKKMLSHFTEIEDNLEIANEYIFDLKDNSLKKLQNQAQIYNNAILLRGMEGDSMQCFYVFEKISTFIKDGINPKDIAVILPDEEFSEILMNYDKNNMLNFAMGKKAKNSLFYRLLDVLSKAILEGEEVILSNDYIEKNDSLTTINIFLNKSGVEDEFFKILKAKFYVDIDFSEFKEIILKAFSYTNESELKEKIDVILFNIENYLLNEKFTLQKILEIFLMELKDVSLDYVGGGEVGVIGLLESRGLSFEGVIIPKFNDDLVPKRSINEMFLNTAIRKKAGLISYEDRQNLQIFYYKNLINKAKKVAICYDKSENKIPSRFLKEFKIIDDTKYNCKSYLNIFKSKNIFTNSDLNLVFKHNFFEEPLSFSRLNLFLICPRCYALKYILKIKSPKDVNGDMDAKEKGTILHKALELCYDESSVFDFNIFKKEFLKLANGISKLEQIIILNEFKDVSKAIMEHENKGYRLVQKELSLQTIFEGVLLKGTIDRVDELGGKKFIIDYKSGGVDDKSLQLPFYQALLGESNSEARYFSMKEAKFIESKMGIEDLKAQIDYLKELSNKEFDFNVNNDHKYKEYKILCD